MSIFRVIPPPVTVMVAVRWKGIKLAVVLTFTVLSPDPEVGDTVNHDAPLREIDQDILDVIANDFCSSFSVKFIEVTDTDK